MNRLEFDSMIKELDQEKYKLYFQRCDKNIENNTFSYDVETDKEGYDYILENVAYSEIEEEIELENTIMLKVTFIEEK